MNWKERIIFSKIPLSLPCIKPTDSSVGYYKVLYYSKVLGLFCVSWYLRRFRFFFRQFYIYDCSIIKPKAQSFIL